MKVNLQLALVVLCVQYVYVWDNFLLHIQDVLNNCERNRNTNNIYVIEETINQLNFILRTLLNIQESQNWNYLSQGTRDYIQELNSELNVIYVIWLSTRSEREILPICTVSAICEREALHVNYPGRPAIVIEENRVTELRNNHFTWQQISRMLGVNVTTLWRYRVANGLIEDRRTLTDEELLQYIRSYCLNNPGTGYRIIQGSLRSRGIYVQRSRVMCALRSIDPVASATRWRSFIRRRVYSVPGPNALWHMDSHHRLIRWRMVTHGMIDGYSRLIIYLHAADNNRAETPYECFTTGVQRYGWPSRIRGDRGVENVLVAQAMIAYRGDGRGSFIAGASVHNQRIERLWRDAFRCVLIEYYNIFYSMEDSGVFDPCDEMHLYALHFIYLPIIQNSLTNFMEAWNNHQMRSVRNWSPNQIWLNGIISPLNANQTAIQNLTRHDEESVNIHESLVVNNISALQEGTGIIIPRINFTPTENQLLQLRNVNINVLYGSVEDIELFRLVLNVLQNS